MEKKILIAVPCMDMVSARFAQSLATLKRVHKCSISFLSGSLIYDSRNKLAGLAVEMEADYILWLEIVKLREEEHKMADSITTIQSGIKHHENDHITDYALFMGGTNVTHDVLMNYDPLKTGYGRLFMVRKPVFLQHHQSHLHKLYLQLDYLHMLYIQYMYYLTRLLVVMLVSRLKFRQLLLMIQTVLLLTVMNSQVHLFVK